MGNSGKMPDHIVVGVWMAVEPPRQKCPSKGLRERHAAAGVQVHEVRCDMSLFSPVPVITTS